MKYIILIIGLLLSLFGYSWIAAVWIMMTGFPEPGTSSSTYAGIMVIGILPLLCGIVLCFFAIKKWLKSRKNKVRILNPESGNEKSTNPATADMHRRMKRAVIQHTLFLTVPGIIVIVLELNWLGFDWWVYWPLALLGLLILSLATFAGVRWGYAISMGNRDGKR
jgi:hypothetical protein